MISRSEAAPDTRGGPLMGQCGSSAQAAGGVQSLRSSEKSGSAAEAAEKESAAAAEQKEAPAASARTSVRNYEGIAYLKSSFTGRKDARRISCNNT